MLDKRLRASVVTIVDIAYGGELGLQQATTLTADTLSNMQLVREIKVLSQYYEEISRDSGCYCFGIEDTMAALEAGAMETLVVWEQLDMTRFELRDPTSGATHVRYLTAKEQQSATTMAALFEGSNSASLELVSAEQLIEWLVEHYTEYGTTLRLVSDESKEGHQFVRGFGGLGGLLRWAFDFSHTRADGDNDSLGWSSDEEEEEDTDDDDDGASSGTSGSACAGPQN